MSNYFNSVPKIFLFRKRTPAPAHWFMIQTFSREIHFRAKTSDVRYF